MLRDVVSRCRPTRVAAVEPDSRFIPALRTAVPGAEIGPFLERCESWRQRHAREPSLLLVLGRLCAIAGLWGKAQAYLEQSIEVRQDARAHVELARVFEGTGRAGDAARHYRMAALLPAGG